MIAAITGWVKTIILVVLFASFLELLLPASSMQRFARVIVGLLVMLTMLNPIVDLLQNHLSPQMVPAWSSKSSYGQDRVLERAGTVSAQRNQMAEQLFKRDLAKQIRAVVLTMDGVADAKVAIELKDSADGRLGAVDKITVYVRPGGPEATAKVPRVTAGASADGVRQELPEAVKAKISRNVRELYQLRDNQVEIQQLN